MFVESTNRRASTLKLAVENTRNYFLKNLASQLPFTAIHYMHKIKAKFSHLQIKTNEQDFE